MKITFIVLSLVSWNLCWRPT